MRIKELKILIKNLDDNLEVILSSDAEGNTYNQAYGYSKNLYYCEKDRCVYDEEELKEFRVKNSKKCFVLWPR